MVHGTTSVVEDQGRTPSPRASADRQKRWFWRFWLGSTISRSGDTVTLVALPLLAVLTLRATPLEVSLITAANFAAWIAIGLPAGVLVHRWPLRTVQVAMDLVRALALATIPLAVVLGVLSLAQVVTVALILGLGQVVFDVGNSTFLPSIVEPEHLTARNSLVSVSDSVVALAGPALGGLLVAAVGAADGLIVDAASFALSAALLRSLPRPRPMSPTAARASVPAQVGVGLRYVLEHDVIRPCAATATVVNFVCGGLLALTPLFLVRTLGAPTAVVGLVIACEGAGSLVGAALTTRLVGRFGSARLFRWAAATSGAGALLLPLASGGPALVVFGLGNAVFAGGVVTISILARTHRQTAVPAALLPRVMATVRFISWGVVPAGALLAGLTASAAGPRTAFWVLAACTLCAPLMLWRGPLRHRERLED